MKRLTDDTPLLGLTNIGPTIAKRLAAVGVHTVGDLVTAGVANTFLRVKEANPGVTIPVCYYLDSLQGALDGMHWDTLPDKTKKRLCAEAGKREKSSTTGV